jgi:hypothetical protein
MMDHDFSTNGSFAVAALQMLLGMSILFQGILRKHNVFGRLVRFIEPYFYSFSPVALLVYLLYIVSYRLI